MTKPNRAMELYRFAAAVMILCYHCYWFAFREDGTQFIGYYLFVELFFILSGFLMMRSIRRNVTPEHRLDAANTTVRYIGNRLRAFYPHHLLSLALVFFIEAFLRKSMFPIELAEAAWPELFLVNIFGFVRGGYVNIVCWYLSALLFSSVIIYYWLLKDEEGFVKIAAPVILVIFYGCLFDRKGSFATTIIFTRYSAPLGFMRAVADMTAGVLTFRVYEWLEGTEFPGEAAVSTVVELAVLFTSGLYMYGCTGKFDFAFVPLFCAFVLSVFRGKSLLTLAFDNPLSEWLGRQSFAFFLNNAVVIYLYMYLFPDSTIGPMCVFCIPACLVLSVITGFITGANRPKRKRA